jgi:HK97 family phage portal protein
MILSRVVNRNANSRYVYAKMLDGTTPVYSTTRDVYSYDIVQMAIDCIATEISKLQPRHIRTDRDRMQTTPNSAINRLFKFAPNDLMTTRDFLEKVVWQLYTQYNCFIYPMYDTITDRDGNVRREYTGFYPLNPSVVTFLQDEAGTLFVRFEFMGGAHFELPYDSVIHLRKRFSQNEIMGGGMNGRPDTSALLKAASINETVTEGLAKAVKSSLTIRGILKIQTMLDDETRKAERDKFEAVIKSGDMGILPLDIKSEYVDLKPDPKMIDKDTLEFIQSKVLFWYGVPLKILSGDFSDEEYQAWYEKTLEPLIISFGQAFSKALFTNREMNFGNEIVFYHRNMMYLSTNSKLKLIEIAGQQGLLTDDQKLAILGYPPLGDGTGARRTISLNFVSTDIADEYQLNRAKAPRIDTSN